MPYKSSYKRRQAAHRANPRVYKTRAVIGMAQPMSIVNASAPPASRGFWGVRQRGGKELKFVDVAAAAYVADTTGTVTLLNGVAQGDDFNQRTGRIMDFKSVSIKGLLQPVDAITGTSFCRIIVFWDSQPNGATPVVTDFLVASTAISHNNLNNRSRFKVLLDEQHALGSIDNTTTQAYSTNPSVITINRYVKLPSLRTVNTGTGATVASIQTGAIWMVTIGSNAAGTGGSYSLCTRCRYTDS
ncbi:capsid [uncultured virus]|uniref:Capsid n=1 Tax=uncultured virus TaxID=340016 RepID=A0A2K9LWF4_9VIRU|nr:capsid [uncultured virus]